MLSALNGHYNLMFSDSASNDYVNFARATANAVRKQGRLLNDSIRRELALNLEDNALKQG